MGQSDSHDIAPKIVAIECASVVELALKYLQGSVDEKRTLSRDYLVDRLHRQCCMISDGATRDVWLCLYHSLFQLVHRFIDGQSVSVNDVENMFGHFQDLGDEVRVEYDLATQILLAVYQMLSLAKNRRTMHINELWELHVAIRHLVDSSKRRFVEAKERISAPHYRGVCEFFKHIYSPYTGKRSQFSSRSKSLSAPDESSKIKSDPPFNSLKAKKSCDTAKEEGDEKVSKITSTEDSDERSESSSRKGTFSSPKTWIK